MRIGLQILIAVTLFACIMTAVGYVLLVQLNKPESLAKGMGELMKNSTQIAAFGIFIFIVMAGTMTFLVRSVTSPVKKLRDAADKIAKGDLDVKISTTGTNEMGGLSVPFSAMVNLLNRATIH